VQIENALTSHPSVAEAAVISVPDKKYGEVVGAWIKHKAGAKLSRESVRMIVWDSMNPQVSIPTRLNKYIPETVCVECTRMGLVPW
jgi:acyl-coenzyme A synthetase/AMP-(fatty) acid ligase